MKAVSVVNEYRNFFVIMFFQGLQSISERDNIQNKKNR